MNNKIIGILVMTLLIATAVLPVVHPVELNTQNNIKMNIINSPPYPPCNINDTIVYIETLRMDSTVILYNVPSSTWTYG